MSCVGAGNPRDEGTTMLQLRHKHRGDGPLLHGVTLVPKLQLGNSVREAPASSLAKLELRLLGSQAGAWEPAVRVTARSAGHPGCIPIYAPEGTQLMGTR